MELQRVKKEDFLASLPPEWPVDLLPQIQTQLKANPHKVVVLDDDPTGTQTVHGIPVLTEWPVELLRSELENDLPAVYLLTNSRSLPLVEAQALNAEIGRNLVRAARQSGRQFVVVSRSDSTLRGHFPGEVESLAGALEPAFDAWLLNPFFIEGGRYTVNDIHYVAEGEWLTPAGETEFAQDAAFGYRSSNLRHWVAEKMAGRIGAEEVASISIDDLRGGGPPRVTEKLMGLHNGAICVINAAGYRDLEVFVHGLLAAEARGQRFLYRTAAPFVRVRAGLGHRPLLTQANLDLPSSGGGLIVVGSYVPKTTGQVNELLGLSDLETVEIKVTALLNEKQRQVEIDRVTRLTNQALQTNRDVVIYTERKLITGKDAAASLSIGQRISEGLVSIVRSLSVRPRYLLAKGGITSSDVATRGLNVKRAIVRGQILPGVPVWQLDPQSHFPGLIYIVFPGNVGGPQAMASIVRNLKEEP